MKYFCLPSDFKYETIDAYHQINQNCSDSKIIETYGQMAPETVFGSCRVSKQLPSVDKDQLEKYVSYSLDKGIEFNYVVNATCMDNDDLTSTGYYKIKDFFKLLESIGIKYITLALPSLMEIANYVIPDVRIKASTVCQINSPEKAGFYEELGVKRIVLDEDIYRRFDVLKNIRKIYSGELEIIINSFCLNDCPYKMFHYNSFSHTHIEKELYSYYSGRCRSIHTSGENYMKLNWIRPEDLHYYHEIGINYFKIQGRTNVFSGDPVRVVLAYIKEHYDGDLLELLELFSPKRPLSIADTTIDNRKLDGFLEKFVSSPNSCSKVCKECGYCKLYSEASISETDRGMLDIIKDFNKVQQEEFPAVFEKE